MKEKQMNNRKKNALQSKASIRRNKAKLAKNKSLQEMLSKNSIKPIGEIDRKQIPVWELLNKIRNKKLIVSDHYQREFRRDSTWSSQLIADFLIKGATHFDKFHINIRSDESKPWEIIDGQQRLTSLIWFFDGLPFIKPKKINTKNKGNKYTKDYLRLGDCFIPLFTFVGCGIDVSYLTWPEIEQKFKNDSSYVDRLQDLLPSIQSSTFDVTFYKNLDDFEVYSLFRKINNRNILSASDQRNSFGGDANNAIKKMTKKDYVCHTVYAQYSEYHPIFDVVGRKLKWMDFGTSKAAVQELTIQWANFLNNWTNDDFDSDSKDLDAIIVKNNEPGSFEPTYKKLKQLCDFYYNVATNNKKLSMPEKQHPVLFISNYESYVDVDGVEKYRKVDKINGLKGGKRLSMFTTMIWDWVSDKLVVSENGVDKGFIVKNDEAFYRWIVHTVYKKLCNEPNETNVYIEGKLGETAFRNTVRHASVNKSEFVDPIKKWVQPFIDKLLNMDMIELEKIGLQKRDKKRLFTLTDKAFVYTMTAAPDPKTGMYIALENTEGHHIQQYDGPNGETTVNNCAVLPIKEHREIHNH